MRVVLRRAGDRRGAADLVRETDGPLVGLLRSHRAADHEGQAFDPEVLAQQPFLGHHVVADPHPWEVAHGQQPVLPVGVVRGDRQPVADLVDGDDEVLVGIQRVVRADVGVAPDLVRSGVPGGDEDSVVAGLVELAPTSSPRAGSPESRRLPRGRVGPRTRCRSRRGTPRCSRDSRCSCGHPCRLEPGTNPRTVPGRGPGRLARSGRPLERTNPSVATGRVGPSPRYGRFATVSMPLRRIS